MPRIARLKVKGEPAVYHVMTRTALDGFVLGDVEKDFLFDLIKRLSSIYFTEVFGFCIMGNHFHLLVRMHPGSGYSDEEIKNRFQQYFGKDAKKVLIDDQIPYFRAKWENLSEFIKEIKQVFSRFYNRHHHRKGFFWSERFKSVIVDNGETLINCLAYIDLNPIRAGIVEKPEEYRWSSIAYHAQTGNKDEFLSLDFGLKEFGILSAEDRFRRYRYFVYEKGSIKMDHGSQVKSGKMSGVDRFLFRTRYFSDSGIIGSKVFVDQVYQQFKDHFLSKHEKRPKTIKGLEGVYSLKRLSEFI